VERLGIPLTQAYMVATFYKSFSLVPAGSTRSTCVWERPATCAEGSAWWRTSSERWGEAGGTTPDMKFTLETVNCLGACALAPLVRVDQKNYAKVTADRIGKIVKEYRPDGEGTTHGKN